MSTIVVRNLPDEVKSLLVERAHAHKRSMEAEVRAIIAESVQPQSHWGDSFLKGADEFRHRYGGIDLELPERSLPREVDPFE